MTTYIQGTVDISLLRTFQRINFKQYFTKTIIYFIIFFQLIIYWNNLMLVNKNNIKLNLGGTDVPITRNNFVSRHSLNKLCSGMSARFEQLDLRLDNLKVLKSN